MAYGPTAPPALASSSAFLAMEKFSSSDQICHFSIDRLKLPGTATGTPCCQCPFCLRLTMPGELVRLLLRDAIVVVHRVLARLRVVRLHRRLHEQHAVDTRAWRSLTYFVSACLRVLCLPTRPTSM